MNSVSKTMLSFTMILTIFLALKFKGGDSAFFFSKVTITIINKLNEMQLGFHCKDKHHDLGVQYLLVGANYSFKILPDEFMKSTLYFCNFGWITGQHRFDIYIQDRDEATCDEVCSWEILETGPCKIKSTSRECFKWDDVPLGDNEFGQKINTTFGL
ncbi:hypothetical protein VNO77_30702 [Canavalia gladiata]|uniref:S-protein homolog n=1 Tax=Canavalia gladiata TaxID=3824 RepID=A0AAN9KP23_CANGL